ncbi:AimR family lysis-lysogeny pheromone receptor [Bacillus spongiae]|uniref:AimR family lysis-lysogeny pheromone receptor n=1 Tax=Bacillus spongiae TaxID=2683610 RepID=A0ABU8HJV9_9BACI
MVNVLNLLKKDMRRKNIDNKALAPVVKKSPPSVSNYLNGKQHPDFLTFRRIVEHVTHTENRLNFCFNLYIADIAKIDDLHLMLDYCSHQTKNNMLRRTIRRIKAIDPDNKIARLYELIDKRNSYKIKSEKMYLSILNMEDERENPKYTTLKKICHLYCFADKRDFEMVDLMGKEALKGVWYIKEDSTKLSFMLRIKEAIANSHLRKNNVDTARKMAFDILKLSYQSEFPLIHDAMLQLLSQSYLFENPELSLEYITMAVHNFENSPTMKNNLMRRRALEMTHDFIQITLGNFDNLYLTSDAELAYYNVKIGNSELALEILENIKLKNGKLTAFQLLYKAMATNSQQDYFEALKEFQHNSDYFYVAMFEKEIFSNKTTLIV